MSDDYPNGHKYPRLESAIGFDKGARTETPKLCAARMPDGRLCDREDGHLAGECASSAPVHYDHPRLEVDHRIKVRPKLATVPAAAPAPTSSEVVWPAIGAVFTDAISRTLTITEIDPGSFIERHIVGMLAGGASYACSRIVFDATWKPKI